MQIDNEAQAGQAQAGVAQLFNRLFIRFSGPDAQRVERLQQDIGAIALAEDKSDDVHALLRHVALAAGSGKPEYASISRAFAGIGAVLVQTAGQNTGALREGLQQDACAMLMFAEVAAPRQRDGSIRPEHAQPITAAMAGLLAEKPAPSVAGLVTGMRMLLLVRQNPPQSLRSPALAGAGYMDALAGAASRALAACPP